MYRFPCFLIALAPLLASLSVSAQLARIELSAGFYRIEAEVAADDANRAQGLMNRRSMPANHGMLFVFAQAARHCMWMRNTYLPLSVAFLDHEGRILNIEKMQPQTEDNHCAAGGCTLRTGNEPRLVRQQGHQAGSAHCRHRQVAASAVSEARYPRS
jgi:uncharacterized membrane protein (UPF0127 family)